MSAKLTARIQRHSLVQTDGGVMAPESEWVDVEVLAIVGRHAMVRRKGAAPFVVAFKELEGLQ